MRRTTSLLFILCSSIVLLLPLTARATSSQKIYLQGLYNGWQNWSWSAAVNFQSTAYLYGKDTQSIGITYTGAWQGFFLGHTAFSTTPYSTITFWINGGAASGQIIRVQGLANGVAQPAVSLNSFISGGAIAANTWSLVTIPLSALGLTNTNMTGFWLMEGSGSAQPTYYIDDIYLNAAAPALPGVTITGVATNEDSVKVRFKPVIGAADYRIYDANNPTVVKYAGIWHLFDPPWLWLHFATDSKGVPLLPDQLVPDTATSSTPEEIDEPALEIEMNGLTPKTTYKLVIEAVNAVGPCPPGTLYDANNNVLFATCPCGKNVCTLGSDMGCTADGKTSINGQGNYNNSPTAIATATISVTPTGTLTLPSSSAATQVLFDTFTGGGTITPTGSVSPSNGEEFFTMQTKAATWEIHTESADIQSSSVFLMDNHFMDVLFDGGTPNSGQPLHVGHGILALSPVKTVDFSGGKVLHVTEEVDGRFGEDSRRWCDIRLTPANDPYFPMSMETTGQINNTDTDLVLTVLGGEFTVYQSIGPTIPNDPIADDSNNPAIVNQILGPAGHASYNDSGRLQNTLGTQGIQYGRGLDNRSRFDFYISTTQFALYEDGVLISQHALPTPLPFSAAKVYFSHYHYHSALEIAELSGNMRDNDYFQIPSASYETYWLAPFYPYSDERHWDNMGYEVLPASTNWSTLSTISQPPAFAPPVP